MKAGITLKYLLLIIYTTLAGAIRKWGTDNSGFSNVLFAIQLGMSVILLFHPNNFVRKQSGRKHVYVLFLYCLILLFYAFNPLNTSIYHGLYGFVVHSIFWILTLFYLDNQESIRINRYLDIFILLIVLELSIGAFQYKSGAEGFINRYIGLENAGATAMVGDSVRASGTFSYLAGFTSFNTFILFLSCYLLKVKPGSIITFFIVFAGILTGLISGSRGAVLFYVITVIIFISTELSLQQNWGNILRMGGIIIVATGLFHLLNNPLNIQNGLIKSYENFSTRFEQNETEGYKRVKDDISAPFAQQFPYKLSGIGLGATCQGANAWFGLNPLLNSVPFEGELFRLVIEGGYSLLIIRFLFLSYLFYYLKFGLLFKVYLFLTIGLYLSLAFNCYSSIFTACGLILLNHAYPHRFRT